MKVSRDKKSKFDVNFNEVISNNIYELQQKMRNSIRRDIDLKNLYDPVNPMILEKFPGDPKLITDKREYLLEMEMHNITKRCGSTLEKVLPIKHITNTKHLMDINDDECVMEFTTINLNSWLMVEILNHFASRYLNTYVIRSSLTNILTDTIYVYVRNIADEKTERCAINVPDYIDFLYALYSHSVYILQISEKFYYNKDDINYDPLFPHITIHVKDEYMNYLKKIDREITMN